MHRLPRVRLTGTHRAASDHCARGWKPGRVRPEAKSGPDGAFSPFWNRGYPGLRPNFSAQDAPGRGAGSPTGAAAARLPSPGRPARVEPRGRSGSGQSGRSSGSAVGPAPAPGPRPTVMTRGLRPVFGPHWASRRSARPRRPSAAVRGAPRRAGQPRDLGSGPASTRGRGGLGPRVVRPPPAGTSGSGAAPARDSAPCPAGLRDRGGPGAGIRSPSAALFVGTVRGCPLPPGHP